MLVEVGGVAVEAAVAVAVGAEQGAGLALLQGVLVEAAVAVAAEEAAGLALSQMVLVAVLVAVLVTGWLERSRLRMQCVSYVARPGLSPR